MTNNKSKSEPVKAYNNLEFLNSAPARSIRVLCEFLEPEERFKRHQVHNTIVFFGSARITDTQTAEKDFKAAEEAFEKEDTPDTRRALQIARALRKAAPYHDKCMALSKKLTEWSKSIKKPENQLHIVSGGGPGIMEAANHAAFENGGKSIGLGISLPFEQSLNPYCSEDLGLEFHYFFIRKYWFLYLAKAIVVFPGGFGTMDELFEMLTLMQTRKTNKHVPIILFGSEFWNHLINFETFVEWGVISPEDLSLFRVVDEVEEAYQILSGELKEYQN